MLTSQNMAFKEWAVICDALGTGRQSLIIRKGGINEGRDGFRVAHDEFWLFPTYFHEDPAGLIDEAGPWLTAALKNRPASGTLRIQHYAQVTDVFEVRDAALLPRLAGLHIWSPRTVDERFHYRQPGLFALSVRMYVLPEPLVIPDSPHFEGCKSWVDLPSGLSTAGSEPVLDDVEFKRQRSRLHTALAQVV